MVRAVKDQNVTVLELGREYDALDATTIDRTKQFMLGEAERVDPPRLVLDLSDTTYIASTFVEIVLRVWKRVRERNGRMALCGVNPFCAEVFRVMRLDQLWPMYSDRASAVAALSGS